MLLLDFKVNYHLCNFAEVKSPQNTEFFDSLHYLLQENVDMVTSVFKTDTEANLLSFVIKIIFSDTSRRVFWEERLCIRT